VKSFEYVAPKTVKEVVSALKRHGKRATIVAGGTDLLVKMKGRALTPDVVVDIKRVPGLNEIKFDRKKGLTVGACVTMREVELSPIVRKHCAGVAEGAEIVGSVQTRNRATVVGNLCNAAPSADVAPGLMALGAKVKVAGPGGSRTVALENFFTGPGKNILKPGEWVTHVIVPPPPPKTGSAYVRHTTREAMDIAVVGVGAAVTLTPRNGVCKAARIVLGAVAPTPIRAPRAEGLLRGQKLTADLIAQAGQAASEEARPISDQRGSAEFRRELTKVLTERMVTRAYEAAKKG
jgi:carbon-monoxide dehydrogenase medium subunit